MTPTQLCHRRRGWSQRRYQPTSAPLHLKCKNTQAKGGFFNTMDIRLTLYTVTILSTLTLHINHANGQISCEEFSANDPDGTSFSKTNTPRFYKINTDSFVQYGYDADEIEAAIVSASETWNQNGRSGIFVYQGRTTLGEAAEKKVDCASGGTSGHSTSVVLMVKTGVFARAEPRCLDSNDEGSVFSIKFGAENNAGSPYNWTMGIATSTEFDFLSTAVHEFGHTFNVWHPSKSTDAAALQTTANTNSNAVFRDNRRDLYEYDIVCSEQHGGFRTRSDFGDIEHFSNTVSNGLVNTTTVSYTHKEAIKSSFGDLTFGTKKVAHIDSVCLRYVAHGACISGDAVSASNAPKVTVWKEENDDVRIYYGNHFDQSDNTSAPWAQARRISVAGETVTFSSPGLDVCETMTGFYTCTDTRGAYSARRISTAYSDKISRTIFAWAEHAPETTLNRTLYISPGRVDSETLPTPIDIGKTSDVGVGIACALNKGIGGRDCLVAYVPEDDLLSRVHVSLFDLLTTPTGFTIILPSIYELNTNIQTASDIAAWYQQDTDSAGGKFWLAIKEFENSEVSFYSSLDGTSWTIEKSLNAVMVGPDAVGTENGSSNIVIRNY